MAKISILDLQAKKNEGVPLTMVTAYDYPTAQLVDAAGIDMILVGDSLAMVVLGHDSTVALTMEEVLHHCRAVARGRERAFLVGDMPYLSYHLDRVTAVRNAGRLVKEAGMDAVKVEGGRELISNIQAIIQAGIPVMGHLGLTPQTATKLGGFKVQAKTTDSAQRLLDDALKLEEIGCFSLVLEAIPAAVAQVVTEAVSIPTIGIGAGNQTDGQVLVFHDMLGLFDRFVPKFVKQYAQMREPMIAALKQYRDEVMSREFPAAEHSYKVSEEDLKIFLYGDND